MITENADNAFMKTSPPTYLNPIGVISDWGEFRMSASMESLLKGYADPRMPKYFEPAVATGQFKGIRNGLTIEQMSDPVNSNENNSNIVVRFRNANMTTEPHGLYFAAETWFNLAEAALNGWNVGAHTAKECYEKGIAASMEQWGVTSYFHLYYKHKYATWRTHRPNPVYNAPPVSNIPVAFGATAEFNGSKLAPRNGLLYIPPEPEAWAELRRTGFPKLYPRINNANPDASTDAAQCQTVNFSSRRSDH